MQEIVVRSLANYLIIRTNFVERGKWPYEGAFTDRYSSTLFTDQVAKLVLDLVKRRVKGVLHIPAERISHYEIAKLCTPDVKPIKLEDIKDLHLPKDTSLKTIRKVKLAESLLSAKEGYYGSDSGKRSEEV